MSVSRTDPNCGIVHAYVPEKRRDDSTEDEAVAASIISSTLTDQDVIFPSLVTVFEEMQSQALSLDIPLCHHLKRLTLHEVCMLYGIAYLTRSTSDILEPVTQFVCMSSKHSFPECLEILRKFCQDTKEREYINSLKKCLAYVVVHENLDTTVESFWPHPISECEEKDMCEWLSHINKYIIYLFNIFILRKKSLFDFVNFDSNSHFDSVNHRNYIVLGKEKYFRNLCKLFRDFSRNFYSLNRLVNRCQSQVISTIKLAHIYTHVKKQIIELKAYVKILSHRIAMQVPLRALGTTNDIVEIVPLYVEAKFEQIEQALAYFRACFEEISRLGLSHVECSINPLDPSFFLFLCALMDNQLDYYLSNLSESKSKEHLKRLFQSTYAHAPHLHQQLQPVLEEWACIVRTCYHRHFPILLDDFSKKSYLLNIWKKSYEFICSNPEHLIKSYQNDTREFVSHLDRKEQVMECLNIFSSLVAMRCFAPIVLSTKKELNAMHLSNFGHQNPENFSLSEEDTFMYKTCKHAIRLINICDVIENTCTTLELMNSFSKRYSDVIEVTSYEFLCHREELEKRNARTLTPESIKKATFSESPSPYLDALDRSQTSEIVTTQDVLLQAMETQNITETICIEDSLLHLDLAIRCISLVRALRVQGFAIADLYDHFCAYQLYFAYSQAVVFRFLIQKGQDDPDLSVMLRTLGCSTEMQRYGMAKLSLTYKYSEESVHPIKDELWEEIFHEMSHNSTHPKIKEMCLQARTHDVEILQNPVPEKEKQKVKHLIESFESCCRHLQEKESITPDQERYFVLSSMHIQRIARGLEAFSHFSQGLFLDIHLYLILNAAQSAVECLGNAYCWKTKECCLHQEHDFEIHSALLDYAKLLDGFSIRVITAHLNFMNGLNYPNYAFVLHKGKLPKYLDMWLQMYNQSKSGETLSENALCSGRAHILSISSELAEVLTQLISIQ